MTPSLTDRRKPPRSDQRRAQLLAALARLLEDGALDNITVSEIADGAGMKRSGFYFYFENKGAAVVALCEDMYEDMAAGAVSMVERIGTPRERVEAQMHTLVEIWQKHRNLYRAMLDAREMTPEVRELFDSGRESFIEPVAAMIDSERAAGIAPDGPSSTGIATVLLELNERAIEAMAREQELPLKDRIEVLTTIWLRTIYRADTP